MGSIKGNRGAAPGRRAPITRQTSYANTLFPHLPWESSHAAEFRALALGSIEMTTPESQDAASKQRIIKHMNADHHDSVRHRFPAR
jgi:hypothetical protein